MDGVSHSSCFSLSHVLCGTECILGLQEKSQGKDINENYIRYI